METIFFAAFQPEMPEAAAAAVVYIAPQTGPLPDTIEELLLPSPSDCTMLIIPNPAA